MAVVLDREIPKSVDHHPAVVEHKRGIEALQVQVESARAARAKLVIERDGLADRSISTMVALGKLKASEVDARGAKVDEDLARAGAEVTRLEAALGQLQLDGKAIRAQAQADLRVRILAEAGELVTEMDRSFTNIERAAVRLGELRRYNLVNLPTGALGIILGFVAQWRTETRDLRGGR